MAGKILETKMMGVEDTDRSEGRPISMEADEAEDMDLGKLVLDALEAKCRKDGSGYVPREQIELLQQAILCSKAHKDLGLRTKGPKGSKRKNLEEDKKWGRKSNKQMIAEI